MPTLYQPRHADGRTGPVFASMTMACLWIIAQDSIVGWEAAPMKGEPTLMQIQEALTP